MHGLLPILPTSKSAQFVLSKEGHQRVAHPSCLCLGGAFRSGWTGSRAFTLDGFLDRSFLYRGPSTPRPPDPPNHPAKPAGRKGLAGVTLRMTALRLLPSRVI